MGQTNVAVKQESPAELMARLLAENEKLKATVAAQEAKEAAAAGEFKLGFTTQRDDAIVKGADGKDRFVKGAKGGSLRIMLGKQNCFCSMAMGRAIVAHAAEIAKYLDDHKAEITR